MSNSRQLSEQEAAQQLLIRRSARTDLAAFANAIDVPGKPASDDPDEWIFHPVESSLSAHHLLLLRALQQTMETPSGRLMVFMPPGSAKSTYASAVAPAWYLGRYPGHKVILASYGSDLARKHGRKTRAIVRQPRYKAIFGHGLSPESSAADEWALTNGSEYMAGGLLSGLTGNRGNGMIVDDPVKGREDAESDTIRRKTLEAYEDDLETRGVPGAWLALIQTRWHEADLAGSILPEDWDGESGMIRCRDGREWLVLCLPAECDRADDPLGRKIGEYLWPEYMGEAHFAPFKTKPRTWVSLFQQRPSPADGTFFKREWFESAYYRPGTAPKNVNVYMSGDFATLEDDGDWTEIAVWGVCPQGDFWVLDWWHGQKDSGDWTEKLIELFARWRPMFFVGETGQIRRAVAPFLKRRMRELETHVAIEHLSHGGRNKTQNAQSFQGMASMGRVHFPEGAALTTRAVDQLLKFPAGKHDDVVDACGLIGRFLDRTWTAAAPPAPDPAPDFAALPTIGELMQPHRQESW